MDQNVIATQFTAAALIVYLMQWVKRIPWITIVTDDTKQLNKLIGGLLGLAAALGINWEFDPTGGVLTITGLTLAGVGGGAWAWFTQLAMQQVLYDGVAQPAAKKKAAKLPQA